MSTETKGDILRQMEEETSTIEACQVRLHKLKAALEVIDSKPEGRFGDYAINTETNTLRIYARGSLVDSIKDRYGPVIGNDGHGSVNYNRYKWLGNLGDDLKAAGKDGALIPMTRDEMEAHSRQAHYSGSGAVDKKIRAKLK